MKKSQSPEASSKTQETILRRELDGNLSIRASEEEESRSFNLSFSSEEPYDRWYDGPEILDHSDGCTDLSRLNEIGVVLFNHNRDQVIGRIDKAWIENGRGYADITFDDDELSRKICKKVREGTLKGVSVGYKVTNWEYVTENKKSTDARFTGPCYIAKRWLPFEVSIVSIPADATVGVGREMGPKANFMEETMDGIERTEGIVDTQAPDNTGVQIDADGIRNEERARIAEITAMARDFDLDPSEAIQNGTTVDSYRSVIIENMRHAKKPVTAHVEIVDAAEDKFRAAAVDAMLIRGGVEIEKPAEGARNLVGMSLRDMAIEGMVMDGASEKDLRRKSADEIYAMAVRGFYNPEASFPAILDQTIEKAYKEGYNHVPTTFERITTKGSLTDFKTHDNNYVAGPVGEFFEVPENGELKHDVFHDEKLPTRKLKTYGRQFTLSRKAFIDDDIGLVTSLPARYAAAAKKTINKQVYGILMQNPVIYDGAALFGTAHKNLIKTGSAITQTSVQAMIMALSTQLDQFGDAITIRPAQIVVPVGLAFDIYTLFNSPTINTSANTQAVNPLYRYASRIEIVEEPLINSIAGGMGKVMPWFMFGDQSDVNGIEVDYLNGQEIPTIRRTDSVPGQLGFIWDIWLDWGISVMDYRGIVKNPGVAVNLKEALA